MLQIEHIGIAVHSLSEAIPRYELLLNTPCYKREWVESEQVETAFFKMGDGKIELLQSLHNDGVIARFIAKRGEGIHHIAYLVTDIHSSIQHYIKNGFNVLNPEPKKGADNKLVCFIHPKDCFGVLTELCEERK